MYNSWPLARSRLSSGVCARYILMRRGTVEEGKAWLSEVHEQEQLCAATDLEQDKADPTELPLCRRKSTSNRPTSSFKTLR